MTQAPHLLANSRTGTKYGDTKLIDSMAHDGLSDTFDQVAMGVLTEQANARYDLTREEQDEFAAASHQKAARAAKNGVFDDEITPVLIPQRKGDPIEFREDEGIRADTTAESLSKLKPAFAKDGTITAGTGVADLRRRLRGRRHERGEGRRARAAPSLAEIGAHGVVAGPDATLQTQPSRAIAEGLRARGHRPQGPRPDRDQRGVRRGRHRLHPRARHRPGEGQPQRRRHRAGPPGRHERRPDRAATSPSSCAAAAAASVPRPCAAAAVRATP